MFSPDAVNHQVDESPVQGREAIRQMFSLASKSATMVCLVENIFEGRLVVNPGMAQPAQVMQGAILSLCQSQISKLVCPAKNDRGSC